MPVVNPHGTAPASFSPPRIDTWSFLLGGGAMLLVAWFGLLRPSQQHLTGLERQVSHLTRAVSDLNATGNGAKGTNALLAQLQIQARQLGDAEAAFARFEKLAGRISAQTSAIEQATVTLEAVDALHAGITARAPAVGEASTVLDEMADLSAKIQVSRDSAREARSSLAVLDALHQDLTVGMTKIDAATPVLDDVQTLVSRIAGSAADVDHATTVQDRAAQLGRSVIETEQRIVDAERTIDRISGLTSSIVEQETVTGPAEERLRRLVALKSSVVSGADHLDDADAALSRLQDLRDGLRNATTTIGDVQHMIVDVMLLQPAVDRAVAALKPVIELTRTARQADPAAMAPRASVEPARNGGSIPAAPQPTSDTITPVSAPASANPVVGAAPTADVTK